ncbi:type II secretion system protein [bacterium]|nr:type II secretion system protein [bacterium]
MRSSQRAFTIVELTLACSIFALVSILMVTAFRDVGDIWRKAGGKDEAMRNILKAKASLQRDLANSGSKANQWAVAAVPPHLPPGKDSDALTFLSSDAGTSGANWSVQADGSPNFASQITYYGVIPNRPNPGGNTVVAGAADAQGYEQQHPFKWLVRRVDPASSTINSGWTSWLTQPTTYALGPNQQVVCDQLLQLRVIRGAPMWIIELRAVSVAEARRKLALGNVPLSQGPFTVAQQFSVATGN